MSGKTAYYFGVRQCGCHTASMIDDEHTTAADISDFAKRMAKSGRRVVHIEASRDEFRAIVAECTHKKEQQELSALAADKGKEAVGFVAEDGSLHTYLGSDPKPGADLYEYSEPSDVRVAELEAQLAESREREGRMREALTGMLEIHGVTQRYADTHIEIPQSWVDSSEMARKALAADKGKNDE